MTQLIGVAPELLAKHCGQREQLRSHVSVKRLERLAGRDRENVKALLNARLEGTRALRHRFAVFRAFTGDVTKGARQLGAEGGECVAKLLAPCRPVGYRLLKDARNTRIRLRQPG